MYGVCDNLAHCICATKYAPQNRAQTAPPLQANNTYAVLEGFDEWRGTGVARARIDADHTKFLRIRLNGDAVDPASYFIESGSTVIIFNESYLNTLDDGAFHFIAEFSDGVSESIPLVVNKTVGASQTTPHGAAQPGRSGSSIILWGICAVMAMGVAVSATVLRRRKQRASKPEVRKFCAQQG